MPGDLPDIGMDGIDGMVGFDAEADDSRAEGVGVAEAVLRLPAAPDVVAAGCATPA